MDGSPDSSPTISVIIRSRNEEASIDRCFELLSAQITVGSMEVIVVDSGSRDRTTAIADRRGARVIEIPADAFSFGGALNLGAANARGDIMVVLSAHAFPLDSGWLARLLAPFADSRVACASGERFDPDGFPMTVAIEQDIALARRHPEWGYSNGAGAFRAELWRRRPFRADLPGCEDKEWARHWLELGYRCLLSPSLVVDHDHTHDSLLGIYRRARREAAGYGCFLDRSRYSARDLLHDWWSDLRWYSSPVRARLSHRRAARLLGTYAGRRQTAELTAARSGAL